MKKIAVVHDWLVTNAGAEKVLKSILELYPTADLFSLVNFLSHKQREEIIRNKKVNTSFIQNLPFSKNKFRNYLPFFTKAIESFDLKTYDLIISSSWAVAKGVKTHKNQIHICYCHTPIRYAWDLYDEYTSNLIQPKKFLVEQTLQYIKKWDIKTLDRVDYFIANSKFVEKRINETYKRNAKVIYPPVDTSKYTLCLDKSDYYLTASRLVPYKKTKLIVETFNEMPEKKLIVIGEGEDYNSIKKIAKDNIQVLGYQKQEQLIEYMQKAKAFIYAAIEDFGIVPIEAMSCGTPVIALNYGGTAETVKDGFSGIHFQEQTIEDILNAVKKFESINFDYKKISQSVQNYCEDRFKKEIKDFIESKINQA
ncbi:glycosyl transferase family 1 [Halarcobacter mediterraneus]|uniref:Glycosyl transferase family 1 n=1 Tax=Halarcobacter mediterraneus TaxID=2023153 RepID=A0A4Q1AUS7_9BACT|nr:glycosyltransferase [Halarcobacter mediterraneus]RXK12300.1 glycosyl transferase family 1 [Halarcobacter mediterraneus]